MSTKTASKVPVKGSKEASAKAAADANKAAMAKLDKTLPKVSDEDKTKAAAKKASDAAAKTEAAAKAKAEKEAKAAAAAKEKADAKAKKDAEAAEKKAKKDAEAKEKAAALEAGKAEREAAAKVVAEQTKVVEGLTNQLTEAKAKLADARKAARIPGAGGSGSTAVLRQRAPDYVHDKEHKTAGGNASIHCGDETAQKLLGKTLDECYAIAAKISEETEEALRAKYGHLNPGMQRMNLGNKIRGVLNAK